MNELEESILYKQLAAEDANRDRGSYDYTVDALMEGGITPYSIWPESNLNVLSVISGEVDYDSLPSDPVNEFHKGMMFSEQQDIIERNSGQEPLCEAQGLKPCTQEKCVLYNSTLVPPVCREFKIAFRRRN